jgi:hypothetical protein
VASSVLSVDQVVLALRFFFDFLSEGLRDVVKGIFSLSPPLEEEAGVETSLPSADAAMLGDSAEILGKFCWKCSESVEEASTDSRVVVVIVQVVTRY